MARTGQFREALTRLSRRFNALQRGEKRCFGVTMPQCLALELLHSEGPRTVRGLADGLGLETSSATRLVDGLARDGLVERRRDEVDRRRVFLSLTESGRELATRLEGCADGYTERLLACVPRERRRDLLEALRLLADAFERLPGACTCASPAPTKRSRT
jgi:DNA-binding MarR family transcriptional regulator